jgi:hypothetical protein
LFDSEVLQKRRRGGGGEKLRCRPSRTGPARLETRDEEHVQGSLSASEDSTRVVRGDPGRQADGELYVPALGWVVEKTRRDGTDVGPTRRRDLTLWTDDGTWPVGGSGLELRRAATCRVRTRRRAGPVRTRFVL